MAWKADSATTAFKLERAVLLEWLDQAMCLVWPVRTRESGVTAAFKLERAVLPEWLAQAMCLVWPVRTRESGARRLLDPVVWLARPEVPDAAISKAMKETVVLAAMIVLGADVLQVSVSPS